MNKGQSQSTAAPSAPLGIIMLDTQFHRPLGDAGNAASWPFPVVIDRVSKAYANDVVTGRFDAVQPFINSATKLRGSGCKVIISTCGFLARFPRSSFHFADTAVSLSTLFCYEHLSQKLAASGKRAAILTVSAASIDHRIRENCAIPADAIIASPARESHFCRAILDESEPLNVQRAEAEMITLALATQEQHRNIGLWLFECANMPPYRLAVERATGVPVYDALQMGIELHMAAISRGL